MIRFRPSDVLAALQGEPGLASYPVSHGFTRIEFEIPAGFGS